MERKMQRKERKVEGEIKRSIKKEIVEGKKRMYMYWNGTYPEDNTTSDTKERSTRKECRLNQNKIRTKKKKQ